MCRKESILDAGLGREGYGEEGDSCAGAGGGVSASHRDVDGGGRGRSVPKPLPGVLQPGQEGCRWVWGGLQHPGLAGAAASGAGRGGTRLCLQPHRGFSQSQAQSQGFLGHSPALGPRPPSLRGEERRGGLLSPKTLIPPCLPPKS